MLTIVHGACNVCGQPDSSDDRPQCPREAWNHRGVLGEALTPLPSHQRSEGLPQEAELRSDPWERWVKIHMHRSLGGGPEHVWIIIIIYYYYYLLLFYFLN